MARPLVLVYQEYASLNFTPANADLNTCVVAVGKHIRDYSDATDKAAIEVTAAYAAGTSTEFAIPGGKTGMVVEFDTVKCHAADAEMVVLSGSDGMADGKTTLVVTSTTSVMAGDTVRIGSASSKVRSIASATELLLSDEILTDGDENLVFTVTRTASDALLTSGSIEAGTAANSVKVKAVATGTFSYTTAAGATATMSAPLHSAGTFYVEYVAVRTDLNKVTDISSAADVTTLLGKIDARNPLAVAAYMAVSNAGTIIKAYGVTEDTVAGFGAFQTAIASRSDIYCVVPVSHTVQSAVVSALKAQFENQASVDSAINDGIPQKFRMVVAGGFPVSDTKVVYAPSDVTVTLSSNGAGSYLVTGSAATFLTAAVRVGDSVIVGSNTSAGIVTAINSNQTLVISGTGLTTGTGAVTISRTLTVSEQADEYKAIPAGFGSKRVVLVSGTSVDLVGVAGGTAQSTAYLACAVGGMIAGLPPHQGLTNLAISGVSKIHGTHDKFSDTQLAKLSDAGWCMFIQESDSAAPFCIHGVTSDVSGVTEFAEIMSVKNFDYVSESLARQLDRFIGTWNLNSETLGFITQALNAKLEDLKSRKVAKLGAPVISGSVQAMISKISADRAEVFVDLLMPKSLNTIGLHLISR